MGFVNVGYGNIVNDNRIVAVISPDSAPAKRLVGKARDDGMVIDATQGRRTRAVIITDAGYVVLSAILPDTVATRARNYCSQPAVGEQNE